MTARHKPEDHDPLAAYAAGDPDAVRAAAPREPSGAEWDAVRRRIQARVNPSRRTHRRAVVFALAGAAAVAAAVVWVIFSFPVPPKGAQAPEAAEVKPAPSEPHPDPLAEFAVLPMASAGEVVLRRVPGDGLLPVGAHPLAGALSLATAAEVSLDDPDEAWPSLTAAPGAAPMIFAAKPR